MRNKTLWKFINVLFGLSIFILIATVIRTLAYLIIGLQTERIFRTDLIILWGIIAVIIVFRTIAKKVFLEK